MTDPVIVETQIVRHTWGNGEVNVRLSDGTKRQLFTYYADELNFTTKDFNGMTVKEALEVRRQKDIEYLRS